jgi:hypothetical protein
VQTAEVLSGAEIIQIVAGGGISAVLLSNGTVDVGRQLLRGSRRRLDRW